MVMVKILNYLWSNSQDFDHDHRQDPNSSLSKWSTGTEKTFLTIDHGINLRMSVAMVKFLTIDHGANSRLSWSVSYPHPLNRDKNRHAAVTYLYPALQ